MADRMYPVDDFEALIRIYGSQEGGRRTPAFNGIRWDFAYADDAPGKILYMIWPDFLGTNRQSLPNDEALPVGIDLPARMMIQVDKMRTSVHRHRIVPGVRFFCHEGGRRVAEGVATRITRLLLPRGEPSSAEPDATSST